MLNVGLTGGIASGKSTVAGMLAEKGALVIDLDEIAHAVQEPEGPVWREIVHHFGRAILGADRAIDRRKLGAVVFGGPGEAGDPQPPRPSGGVCGVAKADRRNPRGAARCHRPVGYPAAP